MNNTLSFSPKTRIVLWALLWITVLSIGGTTLGLNGWPWRFSNLEPYLYSNNGWHHGGFTVESVRARPPKSQRFVMIGGSACLEAITSDADLEARLREQTKTQAEFASVCSSYTTLSDVAKIVDRIGPNGGTILLLLEPGTLGKGADIQLEHLNRKQGKQLPKYYFLPVPDQIKGTLKEHNLPIPFGYDLLNYIKVAPGQLFMAVRRGITRKGDLFYQRHVLNKRADEKNIVNAAQSMKGIGPEAIAMNIELFRLVIEIAQSHGNTVALVNLPQAEPYRADIYNSFPDYDRIIAELVDETGVGHIDLRDAAPWPKDDFWDTHHMTPHGREKFTRLLVERLAALTKAEAAQ